MYGVPDNLWKQLKLIWEHLKLPESVKVVGLGLKQGFVMFVHLLTPINRVASELNGRFIRRDAGLKTNEVNMN